MSISDPVARSDMGVIGWSLEEEDVNDRRRRGGGWVVPSIRSTVGLVSAVLVSASEWAGMSR